MPGSRYRTQWMAQFYAAAELIRRDYLVSFTLGNAPATDLIIASPHGVNFRVDVKGQRTNNFWRFREREPRNDHFYILVRVPDEPGEAPIYFILKSAEMMRERRLYREHCLQNGQRYDDKQGGMHWTRAFDYQDHWNVLP